MAAPAQYCYCPAALQELRGAREACVQAANQLRARDPGYDSRETLKRATHELREARELCNHVLRAGELIEQLRQVPILFQQAKEILAAADGIRAVAHLSRIEALAPSLERIERINALLDQVHDVRVIHERNA